MECGPARGKIDEEKNSMDQNVPDVGVEGDDQ